MPLSGFPTCEGAVGVTVTLKVPPSTSLHWQIHFAKYFAVPPVGQTSKLHQLHTQEQQFWGLQASQVVSLLPL